MSWDKLCNAVCLWGGHSAQVVNSCSVVMNIWSVLLFSLKGARSYKTVHFFGQDYNILILYKQNLRLFSLSRCLGWPCSWSFLMEEKLLSSGLQQTHYMVRATSQIRCPAFLTLKVLNTLRCWMLWWDRTIVCLCMLHLYTHKSMNSSIDWTYML